MRKYPAHDAFYHFMVTLNKLYLSTPALYEKDYDREGFEWLDCNQEKDCIYAIQRNGISDTVCGIFNFSKEKKRYQPPFKANAEYRILLHTDWERFGGQTREVIGTYQKQVMELAPFSAILLKRM